MNKIILDEKELPKKWYNINSDLPVPLPEPKNPEEKDNISKLPQMFSSGVLEQEMSMERWIKIPKEIREIYKRIGRPTPLFRAKGLEKMLDTPARIYYKREDYSPTGSHKLNTAIAQAYYAKKDGAERLTTETGAGQWGSALSLACSLMGLECKVYMVRVSYNQKPYRKTIMQIYGAEIVPSPSTDTEFGRKILKENPEHPGSLGIAISEAIEEALQNEKAYYSLGSVLNHVLLHQTVIGLELKKQLEIAEETPDIMIGCVGGGSNFGGTILPFVKDKIDGKLDCEFIASEPVACPTLTQGEYRYDYGDTAGMTPLLKMYTLGHDFIPPSVHAGGLRYHGMAPQIALLVKEKIVKARAVSQKSVFESGVTFAKAEGVIPAPETCHAIKVAIDEAKKCKKTGEEKTIVINFSGHGLLDLQGYEDYLTGTLPENNK
ncbi:MAG TPA: TrpB-like pyridoxal phosphate-dependent enzyme [Methanothermobacter sp.]|uniref:Tryptophan synthase beta chain n=1 Tax=Methanothermobacter tenebrarum TaxID=680118 RepID=A0ABM7YBI4_9EURY|nr:TrpB-like pyridoxal phosphate-dependent enzyme [Methanothermobacter tenebrarum]MDI6882584.1 TrpB-like pyridoxal phosphate-dependent enzyme [Methanothermobacter sp.]MDX9693846.1 TrpB-like pyridoxal phosphate-dependent enzyme [Methanothermobacter sp.]BDH78668.1 TrpB-like pyridoxal-phosphate dependent enzyme [Methanothermobacter tenebrarum]HHW16344.1 TrpB-like pyridoxal phosphate-dependent enzyme [Methanothermobacter sp.]HOQ19846.1 TrpB-like pyridoxal phosphate-dependent enzyme [Methanothermob